MQRALDWIKRHRGIVAALAAAWVVLKLGRWLLGGAWALREWIPWDDVGPWLADHWLVAVLAFCGLFAVTFVAVRALIGALDRRGKRKRSERKTVDPGSGPRDGALTPGDPLATRPAGEADAAANLSRR